MAKQYPNEPEYTCPIIDKLINAFSELEENGAEARVDFDVVRGQLEDIRTINESLREDARDFYNAANAAKEALEDLP